MPRYPFQYDKPFRKAFDMELRKYMNPLTGFDIVALDKDLACPDNISLADHIRDTYGEEATGLIRLLIAWNPLG